MQDLGTIPGYLESGAVAINDSGDVVGNAYNSIGGEHAFLYANDSMMDLNNLIPSGTGWTLQYATGINNSGQICGYGTNSTGQQDAFSSRPSPNPPHRPSRCRCDRSVVGQDDPHCGKEQSVVN